MCAGGATLRAQLGNNVHNRIRRNCIDRNCIRHNYACGRSDGSFCGPISGVAGYPRTNLSAHFSSCPRWRCFNRPSDPAFCQHGALHVTSFVSPTSPERAVFKVNVLENHSIPQATRPQHAQLYPGQCIGRLVPSNGEGCQLLREAWGLSFYRP